MAQAKKPVAQSGGAGQAPPWQKYWNYLPFPLSWIILGYVVLTLVTAVALIIANW
jgi:hypothetical protein